MKNRNIVYTIVLMLSSMLFASCSEDATKRIEFAKIVESRTSQDLLNDLYLGSDADIEAIARILNVTPSSVERIRKGESYPTVQFEERIYEVSLYYMQNGQSFSKLRAALDPEYAWYDFKSRDITLATKFHLVKAMVFPVVTYGCESWTVKKAER